MKNDHIFNLAVEFINKIDNKYKIKFAYLFGSFARGQENNHSDIDLAIFFEKNYSDLEEIMIRGDIIETGRSFFNRNVDIVSIERAPLLLKYQIVKDGIILKDYEEIGDFESLTLREYFDFEYYSEIYNQAIIESIKSGDYFGGV